MPIPTPTLPCASATFIARIADPARRGKAVDLTRGDPGFANPEWLRGAYITTLPQGAKGLTVALDPAAKAALATRAAGWRLAHASQADFDLWIQAEVAAISELVAYHSPGTFWSVGRSQKFINILLKYVCAAFYSGIPRFAGFAAANPGVAALTPYLHAPIDRATVVHCISLAATDRGWGDRYTPISWWRQMTLTQYNDMQSVLRCAATAAGPGISPIHYEMVFVW